MHIYFQVLKKSHPFKLFWSYIPNVTLKELIVKFTKYLGNFGTKILCKLANQFVFFEKWDTHLNKPGHTFQKNFRSWSHQDELLKIQTK